MTPHDLLATFETLAEASDGIARLRELVLQLAVRGKLVSQDPNDEPACVLLERIAVEKVRLVKEGKIAKPKLLPPVGEKERPFEVPPGWVWCRLGELAETITKGSSPNWQGITYVEPPQGILFITSENVGVGSLRLDNRKYVESRFNKIELRSILQFGDLLMNIVGASIGRTCIYDLNTVANINQAVCLIRPLLHVIDGSVPFFLHLLNSQSTIMQMFDKQVDMARANLSMGNIARFLIPLPPVAEQHRIVAKVDTLMALLDRLEATQRERETTRAVLRDAALAALRDAPDAGTAEAAWGRIAERMDDLFTDPADVAPLRQAILQLAVRGKLVPQDPNDEPACVLLERIAAEKM